MTIPRKIKITLKLYGAPDSLGRQSFDTAFTDFGGRIRMQTFFANPAATVARIRHNIASQFWFDRYRIRLARSLNRENAV